MITGAATVCVDLSPSTLLKDSAFMDCLSLLRLEIMPSGIRSNSMKKARVKYLNGSVLKKSFMGNPCALRELLA